MFTPEQIKQLEAKLDGNAVSTRSQAGRTLSYIEGWWAISEANRIFGFEKWDSETVEVKCVCERERQMRSGKGWSVSYIAKVRIRVWALDDGSAAEVTREGTGAGHGIDADLGLAHESAIKEAETDARKRALMTFGNPFGLALYDKSQANVETPVTAYADRDIDIHPDGKDFWKCQGPGPSAYQAKKDGLDGVHEQMRQDILKLHTDSARREWIEANLSDIQKMPRSWRVILRADLEEQAQMVQA